MKGYMCKEIVAMSEEWSSLKVVGVPLSFGGQGAFF